MILSINVVASILGLFIGAELIDANDGASVRQGLLIAACFYLISGTFFAFMRLRKVKPLDPNAKKKRHRVGSEAAKYVLAHKRIIALILLDILVWGAAAVVYAGVPGLGKIHHDLAGDPLLKYVGRVGGALGAGMLGGAILAALMGLRRESNLVAFAEPLLCRRLRAAAGAGAALLGEPAVRVRRRAVRKHHDHQRDLTAPVHHAQLHPRPGYGPEKRAGHELLRGVLPGDLATAPRGPEHPVGDLRAGGRCWSWSGW